MKFIFVNRKEGIKTDYSLQKRAICYNAVKSRGVNRETPKKILIGENNIYPFLQLCYSMQNNDLTDQSCQLLSKAGVAQW